MMKIADAALIDAGRMRRLLPVWYLLFETAYIEMTRSYHITC